jgi:aminopeptidase 2
MCLSRGADNSDPDSFQLNTARQVLPGNVVPRHYALTLEPNFEPDANGEYSFVGHVIIDLDVVEDSTSITLNTNELDVTSSKILVDGKTVS